MDGLANGIQYRGLLVEESFVQVLNRCRQLGFGHPLIVFICPAGQKEVAGTGTIDINLSPGPTTNGTYPDILGGAEPFGGALGAQRTARHSPRSITQRLTSKWGLRNNGKSIYGGLGG